MTTHSIERVGDRLKNEQQTQHYYRPLIEGAWKPGDVYFRSVYQPEVYPPDIQVEFDRNWRRVLERNPKAFSGSRARLISLGENRQGKLILEIGPSDYANYRGSVDVLSLADRTALNHALPNPLAAVLMVESSAGLLFAQRGEHLIHRPGALYFPGGNVDFMSGGDRSIFETAARETCEELGIKQQSELTEKLDGITLRGIYYEEMGDAAPTGLITARLKESVDPQSLLTGKGDGDSKGVWLPSEPEKLVQALLEHIDNSLPIALAGVHNYLRRVDPQKADEFMQELVKRSN